MKALDELTSGKVYIDTMLPYLLLRGMDDRVKPFFKRIENQELLAFTSVLTFDELMYRLILAFIKDKYPGSPLDYLRNHENAVLKEFIPVATPLVQRFKSFPRLIIVDISSQDVDVMLDSMEKYHLKPRDALHYAAMFRVDCFTLASNDAHFDNTPHIERFALPQEKAA